jgi:hypothetical protein
MSPPRPVGALPAAARRPRRVAHLGAAAWRSAALTVLAWAVAAGAQTQLPRGGPGLPSPTPLQSGAAQTGTPPAGTGVIIGGNPPPPFGGAPAGAPTVSAPLPQVAGTIPWELLGQVKTARVKDRFIPEFPPAVSRLNRQDVRLVGFMLPLQPGDRQSHFLLTVTSQTCAFCVPAGPEGIVEVRAKTPVKVTFDPILIAGRFEVLRDDPLGVYYRLTNGESLPLR